MRRIFIAYSQENKYLYHRFLKHLKAFELNNNLSFSYYQIIVENEINLKEFENRPDVLFLLISVDFITSGFLEKDFLKNLINGRQIKAIAILLEPCYWENTIIAKLDVKPENKIPVTDKYWGNTELALYQIIKEIEEIFIPNGHNITLNKEEAIFTDSQEDKNMSIQEQYLDLIKKAAFLFSLKKYHEAIKTYREAIKLYQDGFEPDLDYVREQIHICNEEILYHKNIETAEKALEQKNYKTAVKYFKEALNHRHSEEIEEKYQKAKKLLYRLEKKSKSSENPLSQDKTQAANITKKYFLIFLAIIFLVLIVILSIAGYRFYSTSHIKEKSRSSTQVSTGLNNEYFRKTLALADYYSNNQNYTKSLEILTNLENTGLSPEQNKIWKYKLDSTYILAVNNLKTEVDIYLKSGKFNPQTHKTLFNKITFLISLKNIPQAKKIILYDFIHRLNNRYVAYYINYTNQLVRQHQYEKAKRILLFLKQNLSYPTQKQITLIDEKIYKLNKIEELIKQY